MKESRADRRGRQHAESMAKLRAVAGRPLPPRRARVRIAVAYLAVAALVALLPLLSDELWASLTQLAALAGLAALWAALRRATRLVTEAPDEVLDDVLARVRDGFFRDAYQGLGAAAVLAAATMLVLAGGTGPGPQATTALAWALIALVLGLPLVVAAFRLPDVDDVP